MDRLKQSRTLNRWVKIVINNRNVAGIFRIYRLTSWSHMDCSHHSDFTSRRDLNHVSICKGYWLKEISDLPGDSLDTPYNPTRTNSRRTKNLSEKVTLLIKFYLFLNIIILFNFLKSFNFLIYKKHLFYNFF